MEYRELGRSGVKIAPLGLGAGNFADPTPEDEASRIIHRAFDAGINLIDTGNSYSAGESESMIGRILAGSKRRHEAILATKVFYKVGRDLMTKVCRACISYAPAKTRCGGCKRIISICIRFTGPRRRFPLTRP